MKGGNVQGGGVGEDSSLLSMATRTANSSVASTPTHSPKSSLSRYTHPSNNKLHPPNVHLMRQVNEHDDPLRSSGSNGFPTATAGGGRGMVVFQQQQQPQPQDDSFSPGYQNNDDSLGSSDTDSLTGGAGGTSAASLPRHLSLTDLVSIGVGGTVGSGLFVLTGQIAVQYAGPHTDLAFLLSGAAALVSALAFCELAVRRPVAGSTYIYAKHALDQDHSHNNHGAVWSVVAAACLTLEYGVSGAAVARTWGDKFLLYVGTELSWSPALVLALQCGGYVHIPALMISLLCTALLLQGVAESKRVTNIFTSLKMILVFFMIVVGFWIGWFVVKDDDKDDSHHSNEEQGSGGNLRHRLLITAAQGGLGVAGILRGATSSFFGYLGYDEICCVAAEARHPVRDLPRAILGTLVLVTACYILASQALVSMMRHDLNAIDPTSAFPQAFASHGWNWAAQLTALGEVVSLPVVALVTLMAQPRLQLGMARDGLLPASWFAALDQHGNPRRGTLVAGLAMSLLAACVPFNYLDDFISAGILVAFSITNSCLLVERSKRAMKSRLSSASLASATAAASSPPPHHGLLRRIAWYNGLCFLSALLWTHGASWMVGGSGGIVTHGVATVFARTAASLSTLATLACCLYMARVDCKNHHHNHDHESDHPVIILQERGGNKSASNGNGNGHCGPQNENSLGDNHHHHQHHTRSINVESSHSSDHNMEGFPYFQTPLVPYLPCLGIFINWYLIAQLELSGILLLCLYLASVILLYFNTRKSSSPSSCPSSPVLPPSVSMEPWPPSSSHVQEETHHHYQAEYRAVDPRETMVSTTTTTRNARFSDG